MITGMCNGFTFLIFNELDIYNPAPLAAMLTPSLTSYALVIRCAADSFFPTAGIRSPTFPKP